MKYTYSDGEEDSDTGRSTRRSTRNATPFDSGPTVTASGRQVKPRMGGAYGESMLTDQRRDFESMGEDGVEDSDDMPTTTPAGRPARSAARRPSARSREVYGENGESDDESEEAQDSGKEWSGNEDEPDVSESEPDFDDEEEVSDDEIDDDEPEDEKSLVVKLSYRKPRHDSQQLNGQGSRVNGLPILMPKPQPQPPPPVKSFGGHQPMDEDTIEVASPSMLDGTDERKMHISQVNGEPVQAEASRPPMVNGYGNHERAMKPSHSPHPLSQVPMQATDVI